MAALTRQEVEAIVKTAREKGERPNLSKANLRGADLGRVNFRYANLSGADLSGADLRRAVFSKANLSRVDLSEANLSEVYFTEANLSGADLFGTNLSKAHLSKANLSEANLVGADFFGASLFGTYLIKAVAWGTLFISLNLGTVRGLETIVHSGPSHIDNQTMNLSQGQIPERFLRGCGLTDAQIQMAKLHNPNLSSDEITLITYEIHRLLTNNPIQLSPCFISYASRDQALAERLFIDLQNNGVRCWYAPDKLKGGQKLKPQIDEAIRLHDVFLLILSEASMNSQWVKEEIGEAIGGKTLAKILGDEVSKESRLFPIRLVDFEKIEEVWADYGFGDEIREYYIPDFSQWQNPAAYQKAFARLLKDLRASSSL